MNFKSDTSRIGFAGDPGKWTKLAIAVGAASMALTAVNVTAEEAEEEQVELETYTFTGSRVKRTAVEGALPVTVIERADIDRSGDVSVADFIRGLSVNSFGSFRQQSGSSAQGLATVNLRGLGSERTLVLIDGHRAPKAPYAASATDLNAIPLAAVERIEILKDGASAVYGSDAIAGVINVIMRTDYEGASVMYGRSYTSAEGGDKKEGSVLLGVNGDNGNVILGASFNQTDIIYSRNQRDLTPPGASFFSNNTVSSADGFAAVNPVEGACAELGNGYYTVEYPFSDTGERCAFDFTLAAANEASTEVKSLFAKGIYNINEDWDFYSTASFANSESFGRYAPTPAVLFIPADAATAVDHDRDGTPDDVYVYHRFAALGNRDNTVTGYVGDLTTGIKGTIADTVDVDFGARYNEYKTYDVGRNYAVLPIAEQYAADGSYDITDPFGNDEATLNAMKATISRESTWKTEELWLNGTTSLFEMAGGMAGIAAGYEYRGIEYVDQYDSLSEAGVIGGSAGNSSGADRSINSLYTELVLPVMETLELSGAVRYDRYSDYGSDLSPKLSARFTPTDELTLRASYGQGFRAPTLDVISQKPSFSAESVINDEATCLNEGGTYDQAAGCSVSPQVNTYFIANPDLESETSKQFSLGVVFAPTEDFDVSVDAYYIKIEDSITSITPSDIADLDQKGVAPPPGLGCERDENFGGAYVECTAGYGNLGYVKTWGYDIASSYSAELPVGTLSTVLNASYVGNYEENNELESVKYAGTLGAPRWKGDLVTTYAATDFDFSWTMNYTGRQDDGGGADAEAYVTHDFQFNYFTPINSTVTLGVQNAFDKAIPVYAYDGRPYNFYLYNAYGTVSYLRYTQNF